MFRILEHTNFQATHMCGQKTIGQTVHIHIYSKKMIESKLPFTFLLSSRYKQIFLFQTIYIYTHTII